MTELVWDEVGERRYETGVDRGVLYDPSSGAIPWNGLVSVSEKTSRDSTPYFQEGVKYMQHTVSDSYSGTLTAFTYPDELDYLLGSVEVHSGARLHDQVSRPFHLSYRTRVGNDTEGTEHGYKIHVIYNVLANPSDQTNETLTDSNSLSPFAWELTSLPKQFTGRRPTSHISFESRRLPGDKLAAIEAAIYDAGSALPDLADLLEMAA